MWRRVRNQCHLFHTQEISYQTSKKFQWEWTLCNGKPRCTTWFLEESSFPGFTSRPGKLEKSNLLPIRLRFYVQQQRGALHARRGSAYRGRVLVALKRWCQECTHGECKRLTRRAVLTQLGDTFPSSYWFSVHQKTKHTNAGSSPTPTIH